MQETWFQSLGWEDPLEKGMAYPLLYSYLENPIGRGLQSMRMKRVEHVWATHIWKKKENWNKKHCSVQFSHSFVSDSLWPHELQHARPPCPSPTPRVHPDSGPSSRWCHPTISSSVVPFSSCPQSFPATGSFQISQFFTSGGQSIRASVQHQSFQWVFRTDFL